VISLMQIFGKHYLVNFNPNSYITPTFSLCCY
jgi:hypothetical protein